MKKHIAIVALSLSIAMLTACTGNAEGPDSTGDSTPTSSASDFSGAPVSRKPAGNSGAPENPVNEITAQFEIPFGEPVDLTNAVVSGIDGEIPFSEMTADNWLSVTCDYVYLAEPLGIAYNSDSDAGIFNEDELTFEGAPKSVAHTYKKYRIGDTVCGLTLTYAYTTFIPDLTFASPKYFNGGAAYFDGQLTLTGKCRLSPEDEIYITKRDIQFIPDADSSILPIMNYLTDEKGNEPLRWGIAPGLTWCGEYYTTISLGNADDYSNFDFSDFPDDGTFINVKVTVDHVMLRNEYSKMVVFSAKILELEVSEG